MSVPSEIDPDLLDPIPSNPLPTLVRWFEEARACDSIPNPEAMAVASVDAAAARSNASSMSTPHVASVAASAPALAPIERELRKS